MQSGDTLERIARKVLSDGRKWREIYEWNRDQIPEPGRLHVGQVLKIKQSASGTNAALPSASGTASRAEVIDEPVQSPAKITSAKPAATVANTNSEQQPQIMSTTSGAIFP